MTLPTDPLGVYDLLAADTALMALVGVYALADGTTRPAIACLWANERGPGGSTTAGVEVVVARGTSGTAETFLTGGEAVTRVIRLYVTQWQPASGTANLEAAVVRIGQLLPGATWQPINLPDGLTGLGQYAVRWDAEEADRWAEN
jgi:hypothetical protein